MKVREAPDSGSYDLGTRYSKAKPVLRGPLIDTALGRLVGGFFVGAADGERQAGETQGGEQGTLEHDGLQAYRIPERAARPRVGPALGRVGWRTRILARIRQWVIDLYYPVSKRWAVDDADGDDLFDFRGGNRAGDGIGAGVVRIGRDAGGIGGPPAELTEAAARDYVVNELGIAEYNFLKHGFNRERMWTEYINRLIGVLVGFFIFGTFLLSLRHWKEDRALVWGSLAAFLLVGFQGWLGGVVVRSQLERGMITLHMFTAMVLMCLLVWIVVRAGGKGAPTVLRPARGPRDGVVCGGLCASAAGNASA